MVTLAIPIGDLTSGTVGVSPAGFEVGQSPRGVSRWAEEDVGGVSEVEGFTVPAGVDRHRLQVAAVWHPEMGATAA